MERLTTSAFLSRLRWTLGGLLLAVAVVTLWAQEPQQFNRGINVTQGNLITSRGYIYAGGSVLRDFRTNTALTTDGAATWTAAQLLSGYVTRSTVISSTATDVLPTAANLIAAIPGAIAGMSFMTILDVSANVTLTLNGASTGVTYAGGCGTGMATGDVALLFINITSLTTYRAVCLNVNT